MKKKKILKKHLTNKCKKIKNRLMSEKSYKHQKKINKKKIHQKHHYKKRIKKIEVVIPTVIVEPVSLVKEKRRRKSKTKINYFDQNTENAIIEYNKTEDLAKREEIYNTKIKFPFEKLTECIFNTFKFSYFETGPLDVQKECISHLVSNMSKFEAGKGKAFSYFSIIAKHYLIALNNSTYKRRNQHVEIGEEHDEHTVQLQTEDKHYKDVELILSHK